MRFFHTPALLLAAMLAAAAGATPAPGSAEFAWHATLTLPAGASLARVSLPAGAMEQLQSSDARDVRVFNADGAAVAFAFAAPAGATPSPALVQTQAYPAYPLFTAAEGQRPSPGSVQVQLDQAGQQASVWVRFGDTTGSTASPAPAAMQLPSALFDTRQEKQALSALTLQGDLPANTLIHVTVATSTDLAHWTPVATQGPVFRFEGAGAPKQQTLELAQALRLEGRYLRLSWAGQPGLNLSSVTGGVAPALAAAPRVRAPLPPGLAQDSASLTWALNFATPLAALQLSSTRSNTLVPVRILGRNDSSQPWRLLAQTVVYRLGGAGQEISNPAVALGGASVHWLRVEAGNGMGLTGLDLQASVEFDPVELIFVASGQAPFELAAGRVQTPAAAMAPSLLSALVADKVADLPRAGISNMRLTPVAANGSALQRWLPAGTEQRSVLLWLVLLAGVLVLAGAAYALLRQLSAHPAPGAVTAGVPPTRGKG